MQAKLKVFVAMALLAGHVHNAQAASITLVPLDTTLYFLVGDTFSVDIIMDFTDQPTLGGGFDVVFNSGLLAFTSWTAASLGDPAFSREPDLFDGLLESFAFGDFAGLSGPALVGTLEFLVVGFVDSQFVMGGQDTSGIGGPFIDAVDFAGTIPVDYNTITTIPLPAAGWLLLAGLVGLSRMRRCAPSG